MMKSLFEQNGGTYSTVGDYYLPNLTIPDGPEHQIGIWGQRRLDYLKKHRRVLYLNFLTEGTLNEHLTEIEQTAGERMELLTRQMAASQGVTEQMKADNQMKWVGMMNNIRQSADEIVRNELIYG